jgi:RNA polymerase sigma factor (sigma-70 family)
VALNADQDNSLESLTIEQLVNGLRDTPQSQSSDYCRELIRRFEPLLRRYWRRVSRWTDYDDFLQETILRLFRGLPHLSNPKAFPGYFKRVAVGVATDFWRKQSPFEQASDRFFEQIESRMDDDILAGIFVRSYFEELPPREREILTLELVHGHTSDEIAIQTGLTPGAVRMSKSRGLRRLRSLMLRDSRVLANNP